MSAATALFILGMVAVIVSIDNLVFRHQAWERLAGNVGIVLIFGAFYVRYLKQRRTGRAMRPRAHPTRHLRREAARA